MYNEPLLIFHNGGLMRKTHTASFRGVYVDNQRVSVFKQKNRWGLCALGIVLCVMASPLLGTLVFMPQVVTMVPIFLLAMLGFAGPVGAAVCAGLVIGGAAVLYGTWGGVCALLLIVPTVAASAIALDRDQPFWESVAAGSVAMFASLGAVVAIISMLAGSDVVSALSSLLSDLFAASGSYSDAILGVLSSMNLITLPEGTQSIALIDAQTKKELLKSLLMTMDSVLRLELPMQMATGSVSAGLLGQAALRKGMLRRGEKVAYPKLSTWRVPKGWGRVLGGTLVVLYLLAMLLPESMNTMFYVFSGVFDRVFALQGIAALCYLLKKHGKSVRWQAVVFVAGYFFLGTPAMILGIADQSMDFTRRREELDELENPFDPRTLV